MVKPPPPPLPPILNPCHQVRRTCQEIMSSTSDSPVAIDHDAISALVHDMLDHPRDIKWDEESWHYTGSHIEDLNQRKEHVALYILALDAINFCFWPNDSTLEYHHLALALTQLANNDHTTDSYFFSPTNLANMTVENMKIALEPLLHPHVLPNLTERCRLWNELGAGLLEYFKGKALNVIYACHGNAPRLVHLLISTFAGFRDETIHQAKWLAFYKRAQICVADLNAALTLQLTGMEELTTFADYRVPQLLRHVNILLYSPELSEFVDNQVELNVGGEVAIRAATVVAVDLLTKVYNQIDTNETKMTAVQMDWHLWQVGERLHEQGDMKPHHRVNTIFY